MNSMIEWLTPEKVAMLFWIYAAAVQAMPEPNGSKAYQWLYKFSHFLAANIQVVAKTQPLAQQQTAREAALVVKISELQRKLERYTAIVKEVV